MDEKTADEVRKKRIAKLGGGNGESGSKKHSGDFSQSSADSGAADLHLSTPASSQTQSLSQSATKPSPESMDTEEKPSIPAPASAILSSTQINQLIVSTIQDLMEIKLDGRDNILPDIVQIMDTFKDADGILNVKMMLDYILLEVVMYSANNLQVTSELVLASLSSCYQTASKFIFSQKKSVSAIEVEIVNELKEKAAVVTLLLLDGTISIKDESCLSVSMSLVKLLIKKTFEWNLLCTIISQTLATSQFIFTPFMMNLMECASKLSLVDENPDSCLKTLTDLIIFRDASNRQPFIDLIIAFDNWNPTNIAQDSRGGEIQKLSFLASFMSFSTFAEDTVQVVDKYFSSDGQDARYLNDTYVLLRNSLRLVRLQMSETILNILRYKESRSSMISLLANFLESNSKRTQMQVEEDKVSKDGFMLNLLSCLYDLCIDKIPYTKVDAFYPFHPCRKLKMNDCARLKCTDSEAEKWMQSLSNDSSKQWTEPTFSTECFFFTMRAISLCILPNIKKNNRRLRVIKELSNVIKDLERSKAVWQANPRIKSRNEKILKKWTSQLARLKKAQLCADASVLDPELLTKTLRFYGTMSLFLLSQAGLSCTHRNMPATLAATECSKPVYDIITLLVTLICSPAYIKNPYLLAKLVEVMFTANPSIQNSTNEFCRQIYEHPIALDHLMASLMIFYVDIESTGSHNEFFDKFSIRYQISVIFKTLWANPSHKSQFISTANAAKSDFTRFVNMLTNDTTFLLDESMDSLKTINELQTLMNNPTEWDKLSRETQQSKQKHLAQEERQCRSYLTLGSETVEMFRYLTEYICKPFLIPELADRLAAMLNFNLKQLCGPKCKNLKVMNSQKYGWEPKRLLDSLTAIYINLDCEVFAAALANDERSYHRDLFPDALSKMKIANIKSSIEIEKFTLLWILS
ncbi:hypothetical protein EB796_002739 [Bugula neritina]|uniref:Ubiquitin conjugation factor E4 core domain-containing protein n=1 Tax=Bugula neritina TaxID=10212 RepID=A0A7J7KKU4_BUGNE|nr:hypothetical protein EB796_002739 [Bugula neritina]